MRCYYEELGLQRDANDGDIKTAYRKLALRWHPDKNPESLAEAKEKFQLIQQAYEVLSDAQERSWYDNHREQILRGKNSEYSENCLDVFPYFTSSCYKGYGDDAKGFYKVYADVFVQIASEDIEFMESDDELGCAPAFGNSESNYEEVVGPFYAYWTAYTTKKTYEWLCPYDVREIKERFILRKVEKEMKKIVQGARKERNEEIRNLVSFVRKRDRRVAAYRRVLEERAEANRLKQEEKRREQLRKRKEELAAAKENKVFNEGYEEQLRQLEQAYGSDSDDYTDEEDEDSDCSEADSDDNLDAEETEYELEYVDDLYCVACNKSFKNAKARANHEESKKHRDNVERLRQEMEAEEEAFNDASPEDSLNDVEETLDEIHLSDNLGDSQVEEALSEEESAAIKRNKKNKKSKKAVAKQQQEEDSDVSDDHIQLNQPKSESEDDWSKGKKSTKKSKSKKSATNKGKSSDQVSDPPREVKVTPAIVVNSEEREDPDADPTKSQHTCVTCRLVFDSKNKLFAHLKKTNHGVYIPKAQPDVVGKPPGKAKGKRNK
ncbi:dnaJ homolog subfamily C member 21 [Drosophila pseudoobscura]|uniref:DnaJ homolog subfamily C member 21 n=1 Tax=Drosophila pseudoobscura pseudoobscura TaxID=46245 RepID=A0A6I8USK6_DROPS|nr:dnaJ homolog subfamily C member 21 [Drosophila pseudoobscura]XP_015039181.1 dnaJ homolog subfamily C member 21 [Drosophila pseudoobscura]